jgi:hypothetical protein
MMRGSPSIENTRSHDAARSAAKSLGAFLAVCAVGLLAGLITAQVRLHLGLPGHKALFVMAPVIAARLVFRSAAGATGGMVAAALASLAAGGQMIGASTHLPFAAVAGGVLDIVIGLAERRHLAAHCWMILPAGLAGIAANLVFLAERLLTPLFQSHVLPGLSGQGTRLVSYAVFGLASALLGAGLAAIIRRRGRTSLRS